MKIALAQLNPTVGDLVGNTTLVLDALHEACAVGADVLLTPELMISGYPPEDLLLRPAFLAECERKIDQLINQMPDHITLVVGAPARLTSQCVNAAFVIRRGHLLGWYVKQRLPNHEVFDEARYFVPGLAPFVFNQGGIKIGVAICEDIWTAAPCTLAKQAGAELLLVLNASPYHQTKQAIRQTIAAARVRESDLPLVYCNLVGGQDELIFDGHSFAMNRAGELVFQMPTFSTALNYVHYVQGDLQVGDLQVNEIHHDLCEEASLYQALVMAVRDYVNKNGFPGVLLGMSGGIDSALTLVIACDALGPDCVHAVMMPSRYTAAISVMDARTMVEDLGCHYHHIDIWPLYEAFMQALGPLFDGLPIDTTEENLQSRIRGTLLMALSNKTGRLVLTTSNKSEMTTGYATLYGDMAGGFAVLKDVSKTKVYQLAQWRNDQGKKVIVDRMITRPPSAELRQDQTDQDTLPSYDLLDAILCAHVEKNQSPAEIMAEGHPETVVNQVIRLLKINEHKRHQAPVGPKVTCRAFGKDWRMPITNHFKN